MTGLPNPNLQWALAFVEELANCGLKAVCLAPGSRSTPLTLAFNQHPEIEVYLHLDERSASFFALGMALATDLPVAVVCTSGTAAAELHAAIIEAFQSHIPLLVLTADRPHELRDSGANQTIDQVKMYGDHVRWSVDAALPQAGAPDIALRNLRTLACRAYATADGLVKGPVHINFPFRKPLEPASRDQIPAPAYGRPGVRFELGVLQPAEGQIAYLAGLMAEYRRGFIVCGPRCPGGDFPARVARLAQVTGYPLLADPLSGVRFGPQVEHAPVVGGYESFLANPTWEAPDLVIRFGAVPTSLRLNTYLSQAAPAQVVHVRENGVWADDSHRVTTFVQANAGELCRALAERHPIRPPSAWAQEILAAEQRCWAQTDAYLAQTFFDATVVAEVVAGLPPGANLFVGNSLPVRHLDQFAQPGGKHLRVFGNRGASGIDGTTSTALGIAAAGDAPTVLITGDVAFYHDLSGLLAVRQHLLGNATIVLLNNNGGGIFRRLPMAQLDPPFSALFLTPHGLNFEHVAGMFGLHLERPGGRSELRRALATAIDDPEPYLIEVRTEGGEDLRRLRRVEELVTQGNEA